MVAIKRTTIVTVGVGVAVVVAILMIVGAVRYRRWRTRESYVAAILPPMGQPISQDLLDAIQAYQMSFAEQLTYDPRRDGSLAIPGEPGIRPPMNKMEKTIVAFYQFQSAQLVNAINQRMMYDPRAIRLRSHFSNVLVAILDDTTPPGVLGNMHMHDRGNSIVAINVHASFASVLNIIAHEMAHCALTPTIGIKAEEFTPGELKYPFSSDGHGKTHTDTWKLFVHIGTKFAGWHFIQFLYPGCCQSYDICDLREFDQTKVFAVGSMPPWGKKLVKWA